MSKNDCLWDLEREINRRVNTAVRHRALTTADEQMECRTAPNRERSPFSTLGMLEDGDGSQDPGWMEPA